MRIPLGNRLIVILAVLAPTLIPGAARAQMAEFRDQFQAGRCDLLAEPLAAYRAELRESGRINLQVDYMLSVCRCRLPGLLALRQLPAVYRHLSVSDELLVEDAIVRCEVGNQVVTIPLPAAAVAGKGGSNVSQLSDASADEYASRVFDLDEGNAAMASLNSRGYFPVVATRHFVLTGDIGTEDLQSTGELMEDVLARFVAEFDFSGPQTLTTVYLFAEQSLLREHALNQHGAEISGEMFAYTFPLDASISIWHSGGLGTVGHEVFHALLDRNAPYAPPWLNEGAAALFEEFRSTPDGGIEGTFRADHWRIPHLLDAAKIGPGDLLAMDWRAFDDSISLQAHHAKAKFFAMFLQDRGALRDIVTRYAVRDLFEETDDVAVLEDLLGEDWGTIVRDFEDWLNVTVP